MADLALLTERVYAISHLIPVGAVTTYGHIAKLAGYPSYSRHVGQCMKNLADGSEVPWQRVINSKGLISPRGDAGLGVERQREALEAEGVEVIILPGGAGSKIDLRVYGWFPESVDLG